VIAVSADGANGVGDPAAAVTAPGHDVPTTLPVDRWGFVDGSSFAAAHVSEWSHCCATGSSLGLEQTRAAAADRGRRRLRHRKRRSTNRRMRGDRTRGPGLLL